MKLTDFSKYLLRLHRAPNWPDFCIVIIPTAALLSQSELCGNPVPCSSRSYPEAQSWPYPRSSCPGTRRLPVSQLLPRYRGQRLGREGASTGTQQQQDPPTPVPRGRAALPRTDPCSVSVRSCSPGDAPRCHQHCRGQERTPLEAGQRLSAVFTGDRSWRAPSQSPPPSQAGVPRC